MFKPPVHFASAAAIGAAAPPIGGFPGDGKPVSTGDMFTRAVRPYRAAQPTRSEWVVEGYTPPPPQRPGTSATLPAKEQPVRFASLIQTAIALQQMDAKAAVQYATNGLPERGLARQVMTAAVTGDTKALAALLVRNDVLPDFSGAADVTPLMAAAARGHAGAAEMLAAHPLVNLGRQATAGWTALHFATALRHEETVALLLRHHAPLDLLNAEGKTAFDMAAGAEVEKVFWQSGHFRRYMKALGIHLQKRPKGF